MKLFLLVREKKGDEGLGMSDSRFYFFLICYGVEVKGVHLSAENETDSQYAIRRYANFFFFF